MLRDVVPEDWDGQYHIHLGGKSGELLFFSGCLPAIRSQIPKAKIVLHLHPHYTGIIDGLEHKPDRVVCDDWYSTHVDLLAHQVTRGLRMARRSWGGRTPKALTLLDEATLVTDAYLRHRAAKPFYQLFMDSCGASGLRYEPPWYGKTWAYAGSRAAMVLASTNIHAGGGVRGFNVRPEDWEALAKVVRGQDREPLATGHGDDPRPEMPGWRWIETNAPEVIFDILRASGRVVGFNSGMTFAATRLVPPEGRVTMIDSQGVPMYEFDRMLGVVGERHKQIPIDEANRRGHFDVLREALG